MAPAPHPPSHRLAPPTPTADVPPGARLHPPPVGIALSATARPSACVLPAAHVRYDPRIMHRVVPPTLPDLRVSVHASPRDIAAAFAVPVALVHAHWLTSRSPMELPGFDRSVAAPQPPLTHTHSLHLQHPTTPPRTHTLSPATLAAYTDLAVSVSAKLAAYLAAEHPTTSTPPLEQHHPTPPKRPSRARIQQILDATVVPPPHSHLRPASSRSPAPAPQHSPTPTCAFNLLATHPDLALHRARSEAFKPSTGLYRVARAAAPLQPHASMYVEVTVVNTAGEGGLAIGVAPSSHPLNSLPGTDTRSAALHASGAFVTKEGVWQSACKPLRDGDVVGLAVTRAAIAAEVLFFVNGVFVGRRSTRDDGPALHVAACLYRPGARVRLACCAREWRFFAAAERNVKTLRASCGGEEDVDVEAAMSSTSAVSGSEGGSGCRTSKNRQSPVRCVQVLADGGKDREGTSCGSVLTPADRLLT